MMAQSDPDIMVMQSAEDRQGYNSSDRMDGSGYRSVLDKGQMRSSDVVVFRIRAEQIAQMSLPEDEDVIKALPADRDDQPFEMAVLPRRSRRCGSVALGIWPESSSQTRSEPSSVHTPAYRFAPLAKKLCPTPRFAPGLLPARLGGGKSRNLT